MMRTILITVITCAIPFSGMAQVFSNLDFEYGVYKSQPRKWSIEGEGEHYAAFLDSIQSNSGTKSLCVQLKNAQVFVFLSIPGDLVTGKQIQIEGFLKSPGPDSLEIMMMFHNPVAGRPIASPAYPIGKDWTMISHRASFTPDFSSDRLLVALMAQGTGKFWFDNIRITIDNKDYGNGQADFREPAKNEIKVLNKSIVPIRSLTPSSETRDLDPLDQIIADADIVALGENSHGSAPIYEFKLRMIQHLVKEQGFSIFALESPAVEADRINEFVLSGRGSIDQVIKDLTYPSWQTQEMIDIIEWIKLHNQSSQAKVQFRGFDMQNGSPALEAVVDFSERYDSKLTPAITELRKLYMDPSKNDVSWKQIIEQAEEISRHLNNKSYSNVEFMEVEQIKHYMEMFLQSVPTTNKSRDEYMAENIDWILNHFKGSKIILSADNTHVTKASAKMGHFLKEKYGDEYLPFGFTFSMGTYSAYGPEKYYEVHPPYAGTYEYLFSKSTRRNFILDLRSIKGVELLNHPGGFRSIGSRPQETTQFSEIDLRKHFDVIVYIENSSHTRRIE